MLLTCGWGRDDLLLVLLLGLEVLLRSLGGEICRVEEGGGVLLALDKPFMTGVPNPRAVARYRSAAYSEQVAGECVCVCACTQSSYEQEPLAPPAQSAHLLLTKELSPPPPPPPGC